MEKSFLFFHVMTQVYTTSKKVNGQWTLLFKLLSFFLAGCIQLLKEAIVD